ncbi:MAG TPA: DUF2189 domain-containing protein, partial [Rhodocyclaceae bacterium]|jgi:uncharacterized membrane protein|nr:DUF2189 domain-containing protein [Betaproteobacteria bacterium]HMV00090.1 DUF2189 domain-containing protein [Rhodocyclaceae bacterium]HMV21618.1 DUF2189 domain-containing protein [Rhodocyclaceae bacterium]HMW77814.1 DUF2189 domain-containing protein [Rhodocyclaceae bacterium]HNE43041.1 DUF2189 domain-containing protein [Rhodocyclaceae bacterium]
MTIIPLSRARLIGALASGWQVANATRAISIAYAGVFTLIGVAILGSLLGLGLAPLVIAAAGAFMLVGPAVLAGFFGIAAAREAGERPGLGSVVAGFRRADAGLWVVALVCALLFMIFVTDVATLYSYMVGGVPVWLTDLIPTAANVAGFLQWGIVSGAVFALLLYAVAAFSVPLLCERRAGLVGAVATSVRIVLGNFPVAILWGIMLAALLMGSILLLPLFPLTLPWLAYASRALYRETLPEA